MSRKSYNYKCESFLSRGGREHGFNNVPAIFIPYTTTLTPTYKVDTFNPTYKMSLICYNLLIPEQSSKPKRDFAIGVQLIRRITDK